MLNNEKIEIFNENYIDIINKTNEKYKDKKIFYFIDPPYVLTSNQ
jgi:hypothetical protein